MASPTGYYAGFQITLTPPGITTTKERYDFQPRTLRDADYKPYQRGASMLLTVTVADSAGTAIDLSGGTAKLSLKVNRNDADQDAILIKDTTGGEVVTDDAASGIYYVIFLPGDRLKIPAGVDWLWYDLQWIDASSRVHPLLWGKWTVTERGLDAIT
jgi:hypothetical protein